MDSFLAGEKNEDEKKLEAEIGKKAKTKRDVLTLDSFAMEEDEEEEPAEYCSSPCGGCGCRS